MPPRASAALRSGVSLGVEYASVSQSQQVKRNKYMTEYVKESDSMSTGDPVCPTCGGWSVNCKHPIPGPTSLETYELVHGDKEDTTSREARLDALYSDFRKRIDGMTKPYMLPIAHCGNCHYVMERVGPDHKIARCINPHCIAQGVETEAWIQCT